MTERSSDRPRHDTGMRLVVGLALVIVFEPELAAMSQAGTALVGVCLVVAILVLSLWWFVEDRVDAARSGTPGGEA